MLLTAAGFALGAFAFQQLPVFPAGNWLLLLPLVLWCWWRYPKAGWLFAVFAGFFWAQIHGEVTRPRLLPDGLLQDTVLASGVIQGIPDDNSRRTRFFFAANELRQGNTRLSGFWCFRISWYNQAPRLTAGDTWTLPLRLKKAHGYHNPGGFDYEGWLYARGVIYTGYVKGKGVQTGRKAFSLDRQRQQIAESIGQSNLSRRAGAVIRALVVGDRSGLSREDRTVFAATGTSHLIAISGLHIGLIAAMAYFLAGWFWRRFPPLCSRWPSRVAGAPFAMLAALMYAALAGFSIPTQRALIMLLIVMTGVLLRRSANPPRILGLALFAVVLWDPLSVESAGFWLSFCAVAAILYLVPRLGGRFKWLWLQVGIALALAPVLVWRHLPVSVLSPLVNLIVIPVFGLLIVPLSLFSVFLLVIYPDMAKWPVSVAGWLLDWILVVLDRISLWSPTLHGQSIAVTVPPVIAALALLGLWRFRQVPVHPLGRLSLLSVALLSGVLCKQQVDAPRPNHFRITVLDVGQGLSVVARTATHTLIFDAGPRYPSGFNTGSAVLLPYLQSQGIGKIDRLVLSHSDSDHVGGAPDLLRGVPVGDILAGEPPGLGGAASFQRCRSGETWWWDGVRFEFLYPPAGLFEEGNNASCVLKVSVDGQAALLTGDIERPAEEWLVQNIPDRLRSQVVVAAHHGSASSSAEVFVRTVHARYVLFSAGRGNRWGFPREKVVGRWLASGASTLNTANRGAIEFELGRNRVLSPVSWAIVSRRYWHK
ncbi:DNA internalization-related competence protein ComEC/Rec2 [Thiolapillus sp.]